MSLELAPALLLPVVALLHRSAGRSERREFGWQDRRRAPLVLPDFLPQRRPALPLENPSCVCDLAMPTVLAMNDDVTTPNRRKCCGCACTDTRTHSTLGRPRATQGSGRARACTDTRRRVHTALWAALARRRVSAPDVRPPRNSATLHSSGDRHPHAPPFTRLAPASGEPTAPLSRLLHESTA